MEYYINAMVDEWEHLHAKFEGDPTNCEDLNRSKVQ